MRKIICALALTLLLSSCRNLVPYTDAMRKQHGWDESQLKKIQFYVSEDIILRRELTQGTTEIVSGKIKKVNGKRIEEIIIRQGTPGVLTDMPKENKMLVSFEIDDSHYLSFGVNPNMGDKYVLLASEWDNGSGKVHYHNKVYYTNPDSRFAFLLVDLRRIQKMKIKQRVASGRRVN
ncbi:MAG: hypothetical protein NZM35_02770 [Chitinophagales bacterium]|nr:hypothetical protein [Chitinophagales bacterium]MDW8418112.1 hypothetical protein [Chitinophagales bacterium]